VTLDLPALADLARAHRPDLLFLTVSGAHLYGFPSADSDIDLRGCYQTPLPALVGLRPPAETCERKLELAGREVELVAHEVGKYLRLLTRYNGYILEQVFSPLVVLGHDFLAELRPLARRCVTRGCHHHYRGFLRGRVQLLERESVKRAKSLLYAYRVALTGIHLLRTGEVQADLRVLNETFRLPFLEELIARKVSAERGELTGLDWAFHRAELARWTARLEEAHAVSPLPEEPPAAEVDRFLVGLRLGLRAA
jgi:predicted nucleotidyltransferase